MAELVCTVCPKRCRLHVDEKNGYKVTGNSCSRGKVYGKKELIVPTRAVTFIVKIRGILIARMPAKIDHEIPKEDTFVAVRLLGGITLQAPVHVGDIAVSNLSGLGMNLVVTRSLAKISDAR